MSNIHNYINRQVPTVLYCEKEYNLLPGEHYGPIIRNVYIIECCVEGYGSVIINEKEFSIAPGDCYILFPGDTVIHTADKAEPRKGYWCAVDGLDLGFIFKEAGISSEAPFAPSELFPELCDCVKKMVAEWGNGDAGESLRETACIYEFLGVLMRNKKIAVFDDRIERAIGLMETKYHEKLSVDQIAREVGLERSYFSVLFKEKTTVSPYQYLTNLRIYKACNLLEKEHCKITEAAIATGFDPCNFARIFKRVTGKTPLEYQKPTCEH
ncbi:MAG: helix-turn-helix domain-containing protein [Clostridia bacterium]|nr:helix-turn-helix domain-containing protein [Clostridia bacterium]